MYDNSINPDDQYYIPQNQNQPYVEKPAPQPYAPPVAPIQTQPYIPPAAPIQTQPYAPPVAQMQTQPYASPVAPIQTQPYTQPVTQQIVIQNVVQPVTQQTPQTPQTPPQPYIVQVTPQQYASQPCYFTQPGVGVDSEDFKSKFCCPKAFIWIAFVLSIIYFSYSFVYSGIITVYQILSCIVLLIVGILLNKSVTNKNVKTYNTTLIIYSLYCIFIIIYFINILKSNVNLNNVWVIYGIALKILEIILLIVLLCYRKEFNKLEIPTNQQMAIPPVVL